MLHGMALHEVQCSISRWVLLVPTPDHSTCHANAFERLVAAREILQKFYGMRFADTFKPHKVVYLQAGSAEQQGRGKMELSCA